jgi:AcrR family transcriptional regulator/DNA-binding MarR family transcriptional regulator
MAKAKSRPESARVMPTTGKVAVRRRGVMATKPFSDRGRVAEMQRARLIGAAVPVVDEVGWSGATVAQIAGRARVSRRTFYDLFTDRDDCLLAVLDDAVARIEDELGPVSLEVSWRVRVRGGLWTILSFLDREPVLARVCVVQALRGGPRVLERRGEIFARLAGVLDEGRWESPREETSRLTAEGLVGAAFTIIQARLLRGDREPLTGLTGELMGMIVLPYLGPAAARREQHRKDSTPASVLARKQSRSQRDDRDPLREVPMRLTYRTARVLQAAGEHPGASNRQIGEHADLHDQGQISKLLARLQRLGLLENTGEGQHRGESNAWSLTSLGERITEQLALNTEDHGSAALSTSVPTTKETR